MVFEIVTESPDETRALGRRLAGLLDGGETLLLYGPLGAGKTCFVQGLARGLGVPEEEPVVSPTFVLHTQYHGRLELDHLDAYRLAAAPDIDELGLDEIFESGSVTVVEWADILGDAVPPERIDIQFLVEGETRRRLRATSVPPRNARYGTIVDRLDDHSRDLQA